METPLAESVNGPPMRSSTKEKYREYFRRNPSLINKYRQIEREGNHDMIIYFKKLIGDYMKKDGIVNANTSWMDIPWERAMECKVNHSKVIRQGPGAG